jgi:hypothetical protein
MTATIPAWSQTATSPSSKSDQQMQNAPGSGICAFALWVGGRGGAILVK